MSEKMEVFCSLVWLTLTADKHDFILYKIGLILHSLSETSPSRTGFAQLYPVFFKSKFEELFY